MLNLVQGFIFMKRLIYLLISVFCLNADECYPNNSVYISPEVYRVKRERKGGTIQKGTLGGVRVGYDRLKRYGWYVGLEGNYGYGTLKGHNAGEDTIKSHFSDLWADVRFGYTFQQKCGFRLAFTPFIGVGYGQERNEFISPSPLHLHFKTKYRFVEAGFLSSAQLTENLNVGLRFKALFPYEPKCDVSNDPNHNPVRQNIGERFQYRVDVPIIYSLCEPFEIGLVPFYEYRLFGSHVNYPFDYFKTKILIWGAMIKTEYNY